MNALIEFLLIIITSIFLGLIGIFSLGRMSPTEMIIPVIFLQGSFALAYFGIQRKHRVAAFAVLTLSFSGFVYITNQSVQANEIMRSVLVTGVGSDGLRINPELVAKLRASRVYGADNKYQLELAKRRFNVSLLCASLSFLFVILMSLRAKAKTPWHYKLNGKEFGPVSEEELRSNISSGDIKQTDLIKGPGMSEWVPASYVTEHLSAR